MVAELRRIGNKLALYTDDNDVYRRLYRWNATLCRVPYKKGKNVVGVDMYFEPWARNTVKRVLNGQSLLGI